MRAKPKRSFSPGEKGSRLAPIPTAEVKPAQLAVHMKIAQWSSALNKPVSIYPLLAEATESLVLRLQVPETLLAGKSGAESTVLYTDVEGVLRSTREET